MLQTTCRTLGRPSPRVVRGRPDPRGPPSTSACTPGDKGYGKGGFGESYPKALRIDARAWGNDTLKLDVGTGFEAF